MKQTICIAGKNSIAVDALGHILKNFGDKQILFLPNKTDDGVDDWQPSFKKFASSRSVRQTSLEELYDIGPLVFISLEFAEIIRPARFRSSELFNIHFSLLPKYKGMFTSAHPLLNGERSSGVTLHKIDAGIDTGDIVDQLEFAISIEDTARDLYFKYLKNAYALFAKNIERIVSGNYAQMPQPGILSSYYSKKSIDYSSLKIDFIKTAFEVHNQFRAFTFREYQIPIFNGCQIIRSEITAARSTFKPGTLVEEDDASFLVATIDYNIRLIKDKVVSSGNSERRDARE